MIAATGDDKVNLVTSLLAKTEFGVPRTVGRVNHPNNEWLFTEAWGVDVNVSTPRIMSALVEEAVTVGDLVRLFTFRQGNANLVEMTLPADSPFVGKPSGLVPWPENCALVTILRDGQVYTPDPEQPIEAGDELLFVVPSEVEEELERLLAPEEHQQERTSTSPSSTAGLGAVGDCSRTDSPCIGPSARAFRARMTWTTGFLEPATESFAPDRSGAGPRPRSGSGSPGSIGVWLRASSQAIAARAATCSGQPITSLATPRAATAESALIHPLRPAR